MPTTDEVALGNRIRALITAALGSAAWEGGGGGAATQLDADGTILDVNLIADGEFLKRVGTTVVSGAAGGGGGAPTDAEYVVAAAHASLTAERVLTGVAGQTSIDNATAAQSKVSVQPHLDAADPHTQYALDTDLNTHIADVDGAGAHLTADEDAAVGGTSGIPSLTNKFVTDADARNTNARTPTAHVLADTAGLGAQHTVSGLTARQVLIASAANAAQFRALQEADMPASMTTDAELLAHSGGLDGSASHVPAPGTNGHVLTLVAGARAWAAPSGGGGSASINQIEIDFGNLAIREQVFDIADASIVGNEQIQVWQSYEAATGRQADENEFASFHCVAGAPVAGVGYKLFCRSVDFFCELQGKFMLNVLKG